MTSSVLRRAALTALALTPVGWLTCAAWGLPTALGAHPRQLLPTVAGSPQWSDGRFHNTMPIPAMTPTSARKGLLRQMHDERHNGVPGAPVPLVPPVIPAEAAALAVTWFGHATALLEIDGRRVLVDPVWGDRVSPSPLLGPTRLHPVPGPLEDLPPLDAVLISHDHYDHLDVPTVRRLIRVSDAPFVVPLGIGAHLRGWGVPDERIVELDWHGSTTVGGLTLTCTEARHFSGRFFTRDTTLWASWVIAGPEHRVFFGGDTGYTPAFAAIGAQHGPFDLTLLPVGAYNDAWHAVHMDPEESVRAHGDLGGRVMLPIHWATFNLAFHRWPEPVQRACTAAEARGVRMLVPPPGQRVDVLEPPPLTDWWSGIGSAADAPLHGDAGIVTTMAARLLARALRPRGD